MDETACADGQTCAASGFCVAVHCTARRDCPGAAACLPTGVCGPAECANAGDCGDAGRICREGVCASSSALPECGDGGLCASGKVCNASTHRCGDCNTTTARCAAGFTCRSGSCEAQSTTCNNDAPCLTTGRVCDLQATSCVSCSATHPCPASHTCNAGSCVARARCVDNMCTAPLTCDTGSGYCINAGGVDLCGSCSGDAECMGTGSKCLALNGGTSCGRTCNSTNSLCPTGFTCAMYMGGRQCVPSVGRCSDNCGLPGASCPSGRSCDAPTGLCLAPKSLCDSCGADGECGSTTDKCLALGDGGAKFCTQDCDTSHVGGRPCPSGFTCRDISTGVKQCVPQGGECIVDPCATVTCDRATDLRVCNPARRACVECNTANDCPASDQQCTAQNTCVVPGMCTTDTSCASDPGGRKCCSTGGGRRCSQCCLDADCPQSAHFCVANTCSATQDPCAGVNCPSGSACNPANSQCESTGTGGGHISCSGGAACPGASADCDPMTNTCYNTTGACTADSDCIEGMTCSALGLCIGCAATLYCPGGGTCLPFPGFDICL